MATSPRTASGRIALIAQVLYGLFLLIFGINAFFPFMPMEMGAMPDKAMAFISGLMAAGYILPAQGLIFIVSGALLLIRKYSALALIILFPFNVNRILFHSFLQPAGIWMGLVLTIIHVYLFFVYKDRFAGILKA